MVFPLFLVVLKLDDLSLFEGILIIKKGLNQFGNAVFLIESQIVETFAR